MEEWAITQSRRLLKRFFVLLGIYSLVRVGFYFYHLQIYRQFQSAQIFESFLLGIRFDIAALCMLNLPVVLLHLFPGFSLRFPNFERIIFVGLNSAGIIVSVNDYELFLFLGKRLSMGFFAISEEFWRQLPQIMLNYWYFTLAGITAAFLFYRLDRSIKAPKSTQSLSARILLSFFLVSFTLIGIRGGLQGKSISVQTAFIQGKNELGHLVLNTPYHFFRTVKNEVLNFIKFFPTKDQAVNVILNSRDFRANKNFSEKKNVILIIMESFSLEYFERGYMPFLAELGNRGVFFSQHLANGRRSIEALPSLLCGLPALIDDPISSSAFQSNKFTCLNDVLKSHGYTNYFFHGGSRGTMGFENFTLSHGFDRYLSRVEYPEPGDYDGTWGIFDEPFFQFAAEIVEQIPQPFFAGIFSLSSHQPYTIPEKYRGVFPKGSLEIHESIGYADFALKVFFERVQQSTWFQNTIFIITADHTSKLESSKFQNLIGHFRVPLLIYAPGMDLSGLDSTKVTQHSDIPKTILDFVGLGHIELPATSVSILSKDPGVAMNYADGNSYFLVSDDDVTFVTKQGHESGQKYNWKTGELEVSAPHSGELLKAYLQYLINGLINNDLSL